MLMAKDAQQAADQAVILRKVSELSLNPGMNIQDGMLTTHSERMYFAPEAELLREFLGAPDDQIECPTPGATRAVRPHAPTACRR
jgi:pyruvate-ferredoxin/flavodoxin oxidoreductase